MVHVYNCHPFASQQIVQVEQEPGLVCCGGGTLFVVATGGCKVEAYSVEQEGCPFICRFATMGNVKSIQHSKIGDYLVTIEEKNSATYLRAYTNWRHQAEGKARVGVRLLGHLLRGASVRGGVQMEIIEIPLSEGPFAVACCPVTGDLLVGCENTLVLFALRRQNQQSLQTQSQQILQSTWPNSQQSSSQTQGQTSSSNQNFLDFEHSVILHLPKIKPKQVALCGAYLAVQAELEVLVLKLDASSEPNILDESSDTQKHLAADHLEDQADFMVLPRHQELLGDRAKDCDIPVSIEKTGLEDRGQYTLSYVLFRRFTPDFFQGCSVEETQLHSLQLYPLFTSNQSAPLEEPACMFCFFSLPNAGYLYSLKGGVELLSAYQYPEKVLKAVLTDHLLHVITKSALQCFTVRCAAVAARIEDPYIDTTMKACPPCSLEVCALRMQLFIGLRSVCVYGRHVILLSTADSETPEEPERITQRRGLELKEHTLLTGIFLAVGIDPATTPALESLLSRPFLSRRWTMSSPKETSSAGQGWNIYVVDTVSPLTLYQEMVEYSQRYAETNPQAQSLRHLLSEAHLLLRASLLQTPEQQPKVEGETDTDRPAEKQTVVQTDRQELEEALRENCAQLGDCFSRSSQKDCHLALPYYRMSGLSVTEIITRNRPHPSSPHSYGPGFLFYLKHFLLEETEQILSQEAADEVINIFSQSEPSQLVSVCASPSMINISPAQTLQILQHLEDSAGVSVPLTVTMATMMLCLDDLPQYTQLMERHAEMLLVYGFIEEPRLLLHGGGGGQHAHIRPTALTRQLAKSQPGLLVAAMVALHENNKVQLEQADHIFKELGCGNCLQVDFWEAMLMASSQDAVIQELLFRLASVYIDRLANTKSDTYSNKPHTPSRRKSLKSADDLINSCSHYGALYPWLTVLNPAHTTSSQHQEALYKLQSLLCGPSLSVGSVVPLMECLSEETLWGFSLHLLCATRRGQYDSSIEKLLDRCPQAIIAYANHQLQDKHMALWWQKLLPELCNRTRAATDNSILLAALKETLVVVAMETSPTEFLELIPDDGTASYFLPHLLTCSQRHLLA
ncbi:Hermansky-Pudlak syndrome 3 protein isoform X1 [Epinephelus moara]|uniref:Hermansky-Pudlak syndrome 3 protein isoform X1 n=1 Tax=Epinephelus moara TaxID=300413 RepID=UPI00214E9E72|nr:Hermansky-Pudlak syndrome 3 protein isoform X1 [Epinephelus moara]XP_049911201.1 Hermansky-Pudlak syndrome 3 protein isoform X1 [Epinephelus moara]XP_049911202.1 Hermansky-Pudlak syndrome 3 protein isoform X1 [Epinephelus moara]